MSCASCDKPNDTTPCACEGPGYCPRIGCTLNAFGFETCRSNLAYHELWTRETAPCMEGAGAVQAPASFSLGLGDVVAFLIRVVSLGYLKPWPGCECETRKAWLNKVRLWPIRLPERLKATFRGSGPKNDAPGLRRTHAND